MTNTIYIYTKNLKNLTVALCSFALLPFVAINAHYTGNSWYMGVSALLTASAILGSIRYWNIHKNLDHYDDIRRMENELYVSVPEGK